MLKVDANRSDECRGMLLLQGSYGSLARDTAPGLDLCNEEESMAEGVAKETENLARIFFSHAGSVRVDKISPFMHHLLYHSSSIFTDKHRRTGSQSAFEAAITIQQLMSILGERWKAGGKILLLMKIPHLDLNDWLTITTEAYLEILRARELTQFY